MNAAQIALESGDKYPYELAPGDNPAPPDWAHRAARGVMADFNDRRGIKWELQLIHMDTRKDIVAALAAIIRLAHSEANEADAPENCIVCGGDEPCSHDFDAISWPTP